MYSRSSEFTKVTITCDSYHSLPDLGETRIGWLQYFEDQAKNADSKSNSHQDDEQKNEESHQEDCGQNLQCNTSHSPQQGKDLSDSSFWDKFEDGAPSTPNSR